MGEATVRYADVVRDNARAHRTCAPLRVMTLAMLILAALVPTIARAQAPVYLLQWGSLGGGDGQFNGPHGVAVDVAGNVYVADQNNNRIQKFSDTGTYLGQWGSLGSGNGQFNSPYSVATDAAGDVYVADLSNHRIQKFD